MADSTVRISAEDHSNLRILCAHAKLSQKQAIGEALRALASQYPEARKHLAEAYRQDSAEVT